MKMHWYIVLEAGSPAHAMHTTPTALKEYLEPKVAHVIGEGESREDALADAKDFLALGSR